MLQCTANVTELALGPYQLSWLSLCDQWAMPHFVTPFWLTVLSKSFLLGWFGAHLGETIELLLQNIFGSFVLFAGASDDVETKGQILEDILQGLFGSLLGVIFSWVFSDAPAMIQLEDVYPARVRQGRLKRLLFYLFFWMVGVALPPLIMKITLNNGFPLGTALHSVIFLISFSFIMLAHWNRWVWPFDAREAVTPEARRWKRYGEYWATGIIFTLAISIQNNWNYLYSSTVQVWVFAFAFLCYLLARKCFGKRSAHM